MPLNYANGQTSRLGLLPEPEWRPGSFITAAVINLSIAGCLVFIGMTANHVMQQHEEMVELIAPNTPPPPKPKPIELPKLPPPPVMPQIKLDAAKIVMPTPPKPEPKAVQMEAKIDMPVVKPKEQQIVLAPQPKAALTAAMPAQSTNVKPSTAPVHLGETFGVTPNPNATKPAQVAAIGNVYGGMQGPAVAPHGVVGSTGIGNGLTSGSNAGVAGKVASAGIPVANTANQSNYGKVASAGIPAVQTAGPVQQAVAAIADTSIEVLSKPPAQYTAEARQLKIEGDVVLSVTFLANGQVQVQGVVHGLGHGLDEEARRVAQQIRFRPATHNGHPVDTTKNVSITFQLA